MSKESNFLTTHWPQLMTGCIGFMIVFLLNDKNSILEKNTESIHELNVTIALNTQVAIKNTESLSGLDERVRILEIRPH